MRNDIRDSLHTLLSSPPVSARRIGSRPVVLYGAGNRGRATLAELRKHGHEVAVVIDREASGMVEGCPIVRMDEPAIRQLARDGAIAAIGIFNFMVDPLPIHRALEAAGFADVLGAVELAQTYPGLNSYWIAAADAMAPTPAEGLWLADRLADDDSRRVLLEAIRLRRHYGPEWLREPELHSQYLPANVPIPRRDVSFIDGGAFDGDTIAQMVSSGCTFTSIAAFEPDGANYAALCRRMADLRLPAEITLWPCGLDDTARQASFRSEGLSSSGFSAGGAAIVQTVVLDEAMPGARPTYVKLDIEGAEAAALRGMSGLLRDARPAVAVCVYHAPSDLWQLPRLVDQLLPGASLYLRSHAWNGFELVLYAVPEEKLA
jgi:FkbM family methyltransferase